ncbi:uncharacterized protein LOC8262845 [Ricinus communis]|uniref:Tetrapyrrole biosynthesis uroporphyrinogen III synthase domain-containing protein n=1 Tax=Ricinus communis TaxID=3988 RepID=B9SC14_RICCO|nr:uncharacterized protein LOC8262845 [Ricinus communis]EEF38872.1 conserved hypothetical protein [Ricinus communis]|eukprot:XP_002523533.1 uncharacterized protein LOC8262845 [Ricinus communis]
MMAVAMHSPVTTTAKPTVAFTTPQNYASRLSHLLTLKSLTPLWCPTIITQPTPQTLSSLALHLAPHSISPISAILFPSRTAITAFSKAICSLATPLLHPSHDAMIIGALGKDAELIDSAFLLNICSSINRIRALVPQTATPSGLVQSLGAGGGRRVLCLVPKIVGLKEPPVVPDFLRELEAAGWVPIRVDAYETRWLGPTCAEGIVKEEGLDGVVFTSSAEVEGLLKSLSEYRWDWKMVKQRWPELVVAAHGPVTAAGAERLGVDVDVVSDRFSSFEGVVDALYSRLQGLSSNCL